MRKKTMTSQHGSVFLLVGVAVVLFLALAYAVFKFSVASRPVHQTEQLNIATAVTQYSAALHTGVTRILLRDIELKDIDFTIPANQLAESAKTQHMVFNADGGGVSYTPVNPATVTEVANNPEDFTALRNGNWIFVETQVAHIGTDDKELVAFLDNVKQSVCAAINDQIIGNAKIPMIDVQKSALLSGKKSLSGKSIDAQPFLCIKAKETYLYYHVLAEQ